VDVWLDGYKLQGFEVVSDTGVSYVPVIISFFPGSFRGNGCQFSIFEKTEGPLMQRLS